jgi:hypothetical protein
MNLEDSARSEELRDDPEGAGAEIPRFHAPVRAYGMDRREATPL